MEVGKIRYGERLATADEDQVRTLFSAARPAVELTEDHIVSLIMARRGREAIFGRHLFSDPAWDILLELYAAHLGDRAVFLAELATAIGTPRPTTKRWASALEAQGLVRCDGTDRPDRLRISLTTDGASRMKQLADQWCSAFISISVHCESPAAVSIASCS